MKKIETIVHKTYPLEKLEYIITGEILPSQQAINRNLVFNTRNITVAVSLNYVVIDQRIPTTVSNMLPTSIAFLTVLFFATRDRLIPYTQFGGFSSYFIEIFVIGMITVLILMLYGGKLLKEHLINIKYYPKEWVEIEENEDTITISIDSLNSYKKEINNIKYQGQRNARETNIYNIIDIEDKGQNGTHIRYTISKLAKTNLL
ncbi:MAG: hypothetical protein M3Q44_03480 [bacterium]|nr:hypothetical protein [bacterium]